MKRRLMTAIVGLGILCTSFTTIHAQSMTLKYDGVVHEYNLPPITLYINDEEIDTSLMPPVQIGGTTLVPVREVFEPLGAFVEWQANEKKVYIGYEDKLIILEMDNEYASVNGEQVLLSLPPKIINDKIMVPVRFISEQMGFDVLWENDTRNIYISAPEESEEPDVPEEPDIPEEPDTPEEPDWEMDDILGELAGVKEYYTGSKGEFKNYVSYQQQEQVLIENVVIGGGVDKTIVTLQSNGRITDVELLQLSDRIVLDIANSLNGLSGTTTVTDNPYISSIRTSQYEEDVTRVVLDLKGGATGDVTLSPDRQNIIVELKQQPVEGIVVGSDAKGDYIYVEGISADALVVEDNALKREIAITLNNMYITRNQVWQDIDGEYIEEVSIVNKGNDTEVVLNLHNEELYAYEKEDYLDGVMVRIVKPTYKNITYINGSLYINKVPGLTVDKISIQDNYREREIVVDLGSNYQDFFGYGTYRVEDDVVNSIGITTSGTTKLTIDEKTIHAFNVIDLEDMIVIELVKPKEKYDKIVVLDSGHGGNDPGAIGNGLNEKDICQMQTDAVRDLLESTTDIKVYMTREEDTTLTLAFRTDLANEIEADLFVSIHNNSGPSSATGTEVLYYPSENDPRGQQFAQMVQTNIINNTGMVNRGIKSRPDLYVLRTSNMPAILIEAGFLSNASDASKLQTQQFTDQYARAVVDAIVEAFDTMSFR